MEALAWPIGTVATGRNCVSRADMLCNNAVQSGKELQARVTFSVNS